MYGTYCTLSFKRIHNSVLDSIIHTSILDKQHIMFYLALVFLCDPGELVQQLVPLFQQLVTLGSQMLQLQVGLLAGGGVVGTGHSQCLFCALNK